MKVLITGAGGFIGQKLIAELSVDPTVKIYGLSRHKLENANIEFVQGDILDKERLKEVFQTTAFDVVVHLAAITEHDAIVGDKEATFTTNLSGTVNLLECFNQYCSDSLFLYASTGKVYGKTNEMPITENALVNPQNILGKTKRITEQVIDFFAVPKNRYLICRIFNIYGETQKRTFVVPTIINQMKQSTITLGSVEDQRDYLYIDDLISAFVLCMKASAKFKGVEYINIGSGEPASVNDILHEIESLTGQKLSITIDQRKLRTDETPVEFCCNQKLIEMTGWQQSYSLHEGLKKTLEYEGVIDRCRQ